MAKFRKKPVVIEAVQYGGDYTSIQTIRNIFGLTFEQFNIWDNIDLSNIQMRIVILEGEARVRKGDWIIRDVTGEIYPCKPDIFAATYELVEE